MSGSVDVVVDLLLWSGKVVGEDGLRRRAVGERTMAEARKLGGTQESDGVEPAAREGK